MEIHQDRPPSHDEGGHKEQEEQCITARHIQNMEYVKRSKNDDHTINKRLGSQQQLVAGIPAEGSAIQPDYCPGQYQNSGEI